ncbi:dol-P-Glc:Glc(2)Man(9)GlcNAc(2)-PP-Dol alpha-1,2-glucosyltransferase isoform X2 [Bemisia tabaci]|uniref:dol-P-Glc:Glc(2)Man(9)GlcNAc(2)-PP-Dol alpha-1,2-glucosyltransferase isoform X2 n=1 Tax=Bemisia tabaci TaxID=7038 RepID=UPI003B283F14
MAKNVKRHVLSYLFSFDFFAGVCGFLALLIITKYVFDIVYAHQPEVYIDEIFHVRQAEKIAHGDFQTWDPKITTLPGLYYLTTFAIRGLGFFFAGIRCDLYTLRFANVVGTLMNFLLFYLIHLKIHEKKQDGMSLKVFLSALNLSIFPVLYFFSFLYYTDVISTSFVLLMFFLHLCNLSNLAAIVGGASILMRQTNVIWVLYFFMHTIYDCIIQEAVFQKKIKSIQHFEKLPMKEGFVSIIKVVLSTLKDSLLVRNKKNSFFNRRLVKSILLRSPTYFLLSNERVAHFFIFGPATDWNYCGIHGQFEVQIFFKRFGLYPCFEVHPALIKIEVAWTMEKWGRS